jgi:hypothetical protein
MGNIKEEVISFILFLVFAKFVVPIILVLCFVLRLAFCMVVVETKLGCLESTISRGSD